MAVGQGHVCDCLAHYARLLGNVSNCKFAKITDYASMNSVVLSQDTGRDCSIERRPRSSIFTYFLRS